MLIDLSGFGRSKYVLGKKMPSDTTLNNMRKADLIELLHLAEKNYESMVWMYKNAIDETKCNRCPRENITGGWIPVKDKLPENKQECLTVEKIYVIPDHVDDKDYYIGVKQNVYSEEFGWLLGEKVYYWMPIPKIPKGEYDE